MSTTPAVHLELWISLLIFKQKFETSLMGYSGAWGKLIHEKNLKLKISWLCPLSWFQKLQIKNRFGFQKVAVSQFILRHTFWRNHMGSDMRTAMKNQFELSPFIYDGGTVYEIMNLLNLKRYTLGSRNWKQKPSKPVIPASKSIEWFIEDQTFLQSFVSFGSSLTTFSLFLSLRVCRLSSLYWQERSGKGWGRSQIIDR